MPTVTKTRTKTADPKPKAAASSSTMVEATNQETSVELDDRLLLLIADTLDDLEKIRIATENRARMLTRSVEDKDGEMRGFGYSDDDPEVQPVKKLVESLNLLEHSIELELKRTVRKHPLGPWLKTQVGIGEKQGARLLAAIRDPYIRPEMVKEEDDVVKVEPSRPRSVSELWAYCGLHVIDGAAPARKKGQRSNWNSTAKMRAFLVAESCVKQANSPYRKVYDDARAKYANAQHEVECRRCGPSGKPAQVGSPLPLGHQHGRALRAVMKAVLRDLWDESRKLHGGAE